ncbi:MAG: biotin/lipoyl-binding protein, partial [Candidatus Omnitrophica bacterium]|nr:biotin/lipoyl-binding protein [Candidatus Omnitrophota bacterium]
MFNGKSKHPREDGKIITVNYGSIQNAVSATGNIQPQNRLAVKPPIGGRIEKILVEEGRQVKIGDLLAVMSSTERAALLDAARLQGGSTLKDWEDVY